MILIRLDLKKGKFEKLMEVIIIISEEMIGKLLPYKQSEYK